MKQPDPRLLVAVALTTAVPFVAGIVTNVVTSHWSPIGVVGLIAVGGASTAAAVWSAHLQGAGATDLETIANAPAISSAEPPRDLLPRAVRGRDELTGELTGLVRAPDGRAHVLAGLGGCGKTAIALAVADRTVASGSRAWWLDARNPEALASSLAGLAVDLGIDESAGAAGPAALIPVIRRHLDALAGGWLLVIDDAEQPGPLRESGALNGSEHGLVLVTTRIGADDAWGERATVHRIEELSREVAGQILVDVAGPDAGDAEQAEALAGVLGRLPLALVTAGRFLNSASAPLTATTTFDAYRAALYDRFPEFMDDPATAGGRGNTVMATCELSLDLLARRGRVHARTVMRLVGGFAPAPLPADLLEWPAVRGTRLFRTRVRPLRIGRVGYGAVAHSRTLRDLVEVGLLALQRSTDSHDRELLCVVAHPMVVQTNRSIAEGRPRVWARVTATTVHLVSAAARRHDPEDPGELMWWAAIAPHVIEVLRRSGPDAAGPHRRRLRRLAEAAHRTARALFVGGRYADSHWVARTGRRYVLRRLGLTHAATLRLHNDVANATYGLGRRNAAERTHRYVAAVRRRLAGPGDVETLRSQNNHAAALLGIESFAEALLVCDEALAGAGSRPASRPELLRIRHHRVTALVGLGRLGDAEDEARRTVREYQRLSGYETDALRARSGLANVLTRRGDLASAEAEYRLVLAAQEGLWQPEHPDALTTRSNLAIVLSRMNRLEEAEREHRTVYDLRRQVLGPAHPDTARSHGYLTDVRDRIKPSSLS
ncbi:tetratricopeptide repeat protein [Actinoplanes subtropicus]|uniref:tetratricopeptide repeat protein n=1 Tax=Actinoplanes subtropicus TaxID=543632 RepID=UPI0004C408A5|nr:tetratricopeptide repeat protein [Actinoplanes subtropicus]